MSVWKFLSTLNDSTLITVLIVSFVALAAMLSTAIHVLSRLTTFLLSFARLSTSRRRDTLELVKHLPKSLGR